MTDAPDEKTIELAHQMFDLARQGETDRLAAYVDAGVPANLTDAQGNTLLMLAAYHGHAATVTGLAERGADVDRVNDRGRARWPVRCSRTRRRSSRRCWPQAPTRTRDRPRPARPRRCSGGPTCSADSVARPPSG